MSKRIAKPRRRAVSSVSAGRPRKISREAIVSAASKVMDELGFDALSMRSLAGELGVAHPTLYTYIENIDDVETEVLLAMIDGLPRPGTQNPSKLRGELAAFLVAARGLIRKHPQVVLPPIGSHAWSAFVGLNLAWMEALAAHEADPVAVRSAYNALISFVAHDVERERTYGPDSRARVAKALRKYFPAARPLAGDGAFQTILNRIIDRMLPGLAA